MYTLHDLQDRGLEVGLWSKSIFLQKADLIRSAMLLLSVMLEVGPWI